MLLNKFFHIDRIEKGETPFFQLILDPEHEIFKAHFPGQPIVPGVCQIQILLEAMQIVEQCKLYLREIKNIKYLAVMTPDETPRLALNVQRLQRNQDSLSLIAVFQYGEKVYTKLSLTFVYEEI